MTKQSLHEWESFGVQDSMHAEQAELPYTPCDLNLDATGRALVAGKGPQSVQDQLSIAVLATRFLENIMLRFGDESQETAAILGTLGEFQHSRISKRETVSIISDTLGTHYDLKRDLLKVLEHQESRWGADDFNLPLIPVEPLTPQFLQPAHEPQMRLPSLSTPWSSDNSLLTAFSPPVMSALDRYPDFERSADHKVPISHNNPDLWHASSRAMLYSPVNPNPPLEQPHVQLTSPNIDHASSFPPYPQFDRDVGTIVPHLEQGGIPQQAQYLQPWDNLAYGKSCSEEGQNQDDHRGQPLGNGQHVSSQEAFEALPSENSHLHSRSESVTAVSPRHSLAALSVASSVDSSVLDNSYVMTIPTGEPGIDMLLTPRKRSHKSLMLQPELEEDHGHGTGIHGLNASEDKPTPARLRKGSRNSTLTSQKRSDGGGSYTHSLCGKSFGNRSAVKKHHWGSKNDDLNTTTGCWYRHKKPNISWNDHPSCKDEPKPTPLKLHRARSASEDSKASAVPAMVPSYRNTIPGFPALQGLPHNVAKAVGSSHTPSLFVQDGSEYNGAMQESYLRYHTHSLPRIIAPPSSPFESLLTAVNAAAKIEGPTPKRRNDSVVICNLDAQAIAAERTGQYRSAWAFSPGHRDNDLDQYQEYLPSPTEYSFGVNLQSPTHYVPTSMALVPQLGNISYTPPTVATTVSDRVYMHQHAFMQPNERNATGQGFYSESAYD